MGAKSVIRDWTEVVSWKGVDASSDDLRHLDVALDASARARLHSLVNPSARAMDGAGHP
jgi:hypothetical protein